MATFYFYDLETSGVNPKSSRIMQFAGRRVNERLEPIGEPDNFYIKLSRDVLPEPDAILLTGITPQQTLQDGLTEAEFLKYFHSDILQPNTTFVGFNNIRFDDEFIRYLLYRNFYDPYEWHWKDGCARWDMLDVVRMTRALRPEGIVWPRAADGSPTNRLESLTSVNHIEHTDAHTALSDVDATIAVARLILEKQPKLFHYLLDMKDKKKVRTLVASNSPFAYVSGRYESRYEKMTIALCAAELPDGSGALVYDLRYDPGAWAKRSDDELREALTSYNEDPAERLPYKTLQYNRCPSVAPFSVVDEASAERLAVDKTVIERHAASLAQHTDLTQRVLKLLDEKKKSYQTTLVPDDSDPDARLYDGFLPEGDRGICREVIAADPSQLAGLQPDFSDARLKGLFPLYKARNYPRLLTDAERVSWEAHVERKLFEGSPNQMERFVKRLVELAGRKGLTEHQRYLLEELKLYAESITPAD